ncbi:dipeptidyl aminopeptidase [Massilia eurypsychrophila]|uniref:Dipeptidyl aminopeptidase n=2 Tax=Massilia eurypsychrophila TaxID=1485217 RepID=A0A2G8TJW4_9BURK|nr:dipeptidyl aminopeptidase [Massilia eurypsychrophila]
MMAAAGPCHAAEAARAPPPPIEHFFENAAFSGAMLSPDARSLAAKIGRAGRRDALAVIDLATRRARVVAEFSDADIGDFQWVNDERLLYAVGEKHLARADLEHGGGLYAVNRDGEGFRQLAKRSLSRVSERTVGNLLDWTTEMLDQPGAQDSQFVYVTSAKYERGQFRHVDLLRLDTVSGRATTVQRPAGAADWLLDQHGEPRIVTALEREQAVLYHRDADQWRKLAAANAYTGAGDDIDPRGFAPDGTLYVASRAGGDKAALYRFDLATAKRDAEPLVELKDYDFQGGLVIGNNKLLGVHVLTDARATVWFDGAMKALQQHIDALLPATVNLVTPAPRAQKPWVLVESYSDLQPRTRNLFNTETGVLDKVGTAFASIRPSQMGIQEALRYKVLVHGGPWVRGTEWGWHPESQFLASRGYAVLEPEYRGSTGFGDKHFRAGLKQWGLKMQDDIADGAKWAIAEGIADPKRICIAGASYGGYAALMGLVNDPALYKFGINWVGVTDIGLMYTGAWGARSDFPDAYKQYGIPELIGDLTKDAAQLTATSPLAQAGRIRQPLLMAYGGADQRVPFYHGSKFHAAVKATNAHAEMVVYDAEGHGWALPKNRVDFWSRVEKFFDRHIGGQRPAGQ